MEDTVLKFRAFITIYKYTKYGHILCSIRLLKGNLYGAAPGQAVSRCPPTVAIRVRARFRSCGICGGQSGIGAGFFLSTSVSLPIFIPPISPQSPSFIIWG
jgi:hypothetical protein